MALPLALRRFALLPLGLLLALLVLPLSAAPPEIAVVYPDFPDLGPHLITGEGFTLPGLEVWVWDPPAAADTALLQALAAGDPPALPAQPPTGARRVNPLDVTTRVLTVPLGGIGVWLRNQDGWSAPYRFSVPKPFWISRPRAEAGQSLFVYGFGLRAVYRPTRVALRGAGAPVLAPIFVEPRSPRTPDEHLVYFQVPLDTAPGPYSVFLHNGCGGEFGWVQAGAVEVSAPVDKAPPVFNVRDFGGVGDGRANDFPALRAALDAAGQAGGGVVYLPPGTWRSDTELVMPLNVHLRGASRDNTVLEGFYDAVPADGRTSSLLRVSSGFGLHSLTVRGCVFKGDKSYNVSLVSTAPRAGIETPEDLVIEDCRLLTDSPGEGAGQDLETGVPLYQATLGVWGRGVRLVNNEIFGDSSLGGWRCDLIGNTFHGGATVVIHGWFYDSLLDGNQFVDSPGRVCFYPRRHCYVRYNEVHRAFRGTWANAEEIYLIHGGGAQQAGHPTAVTATTLTDTSQKWQPGKLKDCTVLLTHGRGFGQYRQVIDNTAETLTLDAPWRVLPDTSTEYSVGTKYVENAFFANLNNNASRVSLWLDCLGNLVEYHRDGYGGGLDLWGEDRSDTTAPPGQQNLDRYNPSFFNMIRNCWFDGSYNYVWSNAAPHRAWSGPPVFGTYLVDNKLRSSHMRRTGFAWAERSVGAVIVGNRSRDLTQPQSDRLAVSHTIVARNFLGENNAGVTVSDFAAKTFILDNEFQHVDQPLLDWGAGTLFRGNRRFLIDPRGERTEPLPDLSSSRAFPPALLP